MKLLLAAFTVFLLVVGAGVASGNFHLRSAGVCFGKCDHERSSEFRRLFSYWLQQSNECGIDAQLHSELLSRMAPEVLSRLISDNEELERLAAREEDGTLTVAERQIADNHRGRFQPPRPNSLYATMFGEHLGHPTPMNDNLLHKCYRDGFVYRHDNNVTPEGFCIGYAFQSFTQGRSFNIRPMTQYPEMIENLYRFHVTSRNIEPVIEDMRDSVRTAFKMEDEARELVLNLPASAVDANDIDAEVRRQYLETRCGEEPPS